MLVTGAAGSGKLLSNIASLEKSVLAFAAALPLQKLHAIQAISRVIVGTDQTGWFRVTPDELMGMLGEALKAGGLMDRSQTLSSGAPQVATQKQPGNSSFGMQLKTTHVAVGNSPLLKPPQFLHMYLKLPFQHRVSSSKQQLVQLI